eukprot:3453194-Rhodomonas_salina.3
MRCKLGWFPLLDPDGEPVKGPGRPPPYAICLEPCYAMPGTDVAYGATRRTQTRDSTSEHQPQA